MGIVADSGTTDNYIASGADQRFINPAAIHLVLSKEELEQINGLYQGSGGNLSGLFSNTLSGANNIPSELNIQESKFCRTINYISTVFGLTKKELASVCGVSRKTLYNWIDGVSQPRKKTIKRVFDLFIIAQTWSQSGFTYDEKLLHQPILEETSLFDLLLAENLNQELVLFAGSKINLSSVELNQLEDPFA